MGGPRPGRDTMVEHPSGASEEKVSRNQTVTETEFASEQVEGLGELGAGGLGMSAGIRVFIHWTDAF